MEAGEGKYWIEVKKKHGKKVYKLTEEEEEER